MTAVKICGLSRVSDIEIVNNLSPDYIGFVFAKSRREVSDDLAIYLRARLSPSIKTVGVFVNEDIYRIVNLCQHHIIDLVQLHGDEDFNYINKLRSMIPNKIIKAIRVRNKQDVDNSLDIPCDYLLFDTYSLQEYGGSGKAFDWSLIDGIIRPYFLAGGLNCSNIEEAMDKCKPFGVDVSSGVETEGFKDPEKIRKFIMKVRSAKR